MIVILEDKSEDYQNCSVLYNLFIYNDIVHKVHRTNKQKIKKNTFTLYSTSTGQQS